MHGADQTGRSTRKAITVSKLLRIFFIGMPVANKGWPAIRELTSFGNDARYRFFYVGKEPQPGVPASVSEIAVVEYGDYLKYSAFDRPIDGVIECGEYERLVYRPRAGQILV